MPEAQVQSAGFLLELSPDWLILRASENSHQFLGEYHAPLIGEPLSRFTLAQTLHDLRNSLSRQRSSNGIAHAYRVRLIDQPRYFDIAFQLLESTILLEGLPSPESGFGEWLGAVSRLIDGLQAPDHMTMLNGAARRMRALTGHDRVILVIGDDQVESSRGTLPGSSISEGLPAMIADSASTPVHLFPRKEGEDVDHALLRAPTEKLAEELRSGGVGSSLSVPVCRDGQVLGHFQCDNKVARPPSFEQHAAAELFAQMFGMLLPD